MSERPLGSTGAESLPSISSYDGGGAKENSPVEADVTVSAGGSVGALKITGAENVVSRLPSLGGFTPIST